jgi:hypothetical protein
VAGLINILFGEDTFCRITAARRHRLLLVFTLMLSSFLAQLIVFSFHESGLLTVDKSPGGRVS